MLNHIVSWQMNGDTAEKRAAQAQEVADALNALVGAVPTIETLQAYVNEVDGYNNFDVILVSTFKDKQALDDYVVHPEHQKAAAFIKERAAVRAGVDFTA